MRKYFYSNSYMACAHRGNIFIVILTWHAEIFLQQFLHGMRNIFYSNSYMARAHRGNIQFIVILTWHAHIEEIFNLQQFGQKDMSTQERYRSFNLLVKISMNIAISSFYFGYSNGYFNSIRFNDIVDIYGIQNYSRALVQGLLTGCLSFMGGIGAYSSSYLLKKFSRKQCFQVLAYFALAINLFLQIPNIYVLFLARILQGFCIGMASAIAPLYLKQFSPTELAPTLCLLHQIFIVAGVTVSFALTFLLSLFLPVSTYWRIVFGFPFILNLLQLYNLKFSYPYQTPKWLALNNRQEEALDLLRIIYKQQHPEEILRQIKEAIIQQQKKQPRINQIELKGINQIGSSLLARKSYVLTNNKLAVFTAIHLSIQQQIVGMGPIISYSGEIIGSMIPPIQKVYPIIINAISLLGALGSISVLKKNGRKKTIEMGALFISVFLFLLSFTLLPFDFDNLESNSWLQMATVSILFIVIRMIFSFTLGPVVWIYVSEIVQSNVISVATMINWFTVGLINTLFPIALKMLNGNPGWIFFFFASMTFLAYLIDREVLIETANKSELQIRQEYDAKIK